MDISEVKCSVCPHKQNWIPCENKLPRKDDYYLVTYRFCSEKKLHVYALYYSEELGWCTDEDAGGTDLNGFGWPIEAIAWMPLPEPYMKEGTDS